MPRQWQSILIQIRYIICTYIDEVNLWTFISLELGIYIRYVGTVKRIGM